MKFAIDLTRHDTKTVEVFANDRDAAAQLALERFPGFVIDAATELLDGDVEGASYSLIACCEGCNRTIWDGDKYEAGEDYYECAACAALRPNGGGQRRDD